jgi:serine/threonine-protein kinase HipA
MMKNRAMRANKSLPSPLYVHVWTANSYRLAGTLTLDGTSVDDFSATFAYAETYLADADAEASAANYPLDPINLPLFPSPYHGMSPHLIVGAIFDAAPDAWGRRIIQANDPALSGHSLYRDAFLRGADGIGALVFSADINTNIAEAVHTAKLERPSLDDLERAANAARRFEIDGALNDADKSLLAGSWTIGGARPKAILRDTANPDDASVIVKFAAQDDVLDRSGIEWACLRMARDIGFTVPRHEIIETSTGRALLLGRFDRTPVQVGSEQGRRHYISAYSLISRLPDSKRLDSSRDQIIFSCGNLIALAGRIGAKPSVAKVEMFGRLLLNTALHNTDDHLKNFGFLKDEDATLNYSLAPVFDVSTQVQADHYLHCAGLGRRYTAQEMLAEARQLGIAALAASEMWDKVMDTLAKRAQYFDEAKLSQRDRDAVERLILQGIG